MIDDQRVWEIINLIGVCVLGAFALAAILFILTLSVSRAPTESNSETATSTVR
jgi:hypothetical protein